MSDLSDKQDSPRADAHGNVADGGTAKSKQPFEKPKLTFVPPKLVKQGEVTELTGFFGPFST